MILTSSSSFESQPVFLGGSQWQPNQWRAGQESYRPAILRYRDQLLITWRAQIVSAINLRSQPGFDCFSVRPAQIYFNCTARAQALHRSIGPGSWERRQKVNFVCVTLQKHLCDGRRAAKVSVDLKWRMSIEQVWQRRLREQRNEVFVRTLAFFQPRP